MEITGKIIVSIPEVGGTSSKGNAWRKKEYVLETLDQYPKRICFQLFNDRINQFPLVVGQMAKVSIDIDSREYNGRWYTQVSAYKVESLDSQPAPAPAQSVYQQPPMAQPMSPQMPNEDLPF